MTQTLSPGTTAEPQGPSRRTFLKWSGLAAGVAGLTATTANLGTPNPAAAATAEGLADAERTVWSACTVNCGSRCPLRLQVKDGTVVRVLPDNTGDNTLGSQQVRACVRGRAIRERIYNPDRLKRPMKRKEGTKRGEEQWEEISWDQALTEIAEKMKDIKAKYGNEAFYIQYGTGTLGAVMSCSGLRTPPRRRACSISSAATSTTTRTTPPPPSPRPTPTSTAPGSTPIPSTTSPIPSCR